MVYYLMTTHLAHIASVKTMGNQQRFCSLTANTASCSNFPPKIQNTARLFVVSPSRGFGRRTPTRPTPKTNKAPITIHWNFKGRIFYFSRLQADKLEDHLSLPCLSELHAVAKPDVAYLSAAVNTAEKWAAPGLEAAKHKSSIPT